MSMDAPVKALLIAFVEDAPAAVYVINRLKPDMLCFFLHESAKSLVESAVQPQVAQKDMPAPSARAIVNKR